MCQQVASLVLTLEVMNLVLNNMLSASYRTISIKEVMSLVLNDVSKFRNR